MKEKIKQYITQNNITELELGTEEWVELFMFLTDFEGDVDDFLESGLVENIDTDEVEEILEELDIELI